MDITERRSIPRENTNKSIVIIKDQTQHEVQVMNFNVNGMKLSTLEGVQKDEIVSLVLGDETLQARIVWSNLTSAGIQFLKPVHNIGHLLYVTWTASSE